MLKQFDEIPLTLGEIATACEAVLAEWQVKKYTRTRFFIERTMEKLRERGKEYNPQTVKAKVVQFLNQIEKLGIIERVHKGVYRRLVLTTPTKEAGKWKRKSKS